MSEHRRERVAHQIQAELATLLLRERSLEMAAGRLSRALAGLA